MSSLKIADFSMAMSVKDGPTTTQGGDPANVAPEMLLARPYLTVSSAGLSGLRGGGVETRGLMFSRGGFRSTLLEVLNGAVSETMRGG